MFFWTFRKVFTTFTPSVSIDDEIEIPKFLEAPFQLDLPVKSTKISEVKKYNLEWTLHPNKVPCFDLITGKVLKE